MPESGTKQLVKRNTFLWLVAMAMPAFFHFGFKAFASGPVKFPWPVIIPLLFLGLLLSSNSLIATAAGETTDQPATKKSS